MIKNKVKEIILNTWKELGGSDTISFQTEIPPKNIKADYSTNICMVGAKLLKKSPRNLAEEFINILNSNKNAKDIIEATSIAGPGFVNFILNKKVFYNEVKEIFDKDKEYGKQDIGKGEKVLIEFVSANPTGPLHIGHARGAVIGDTLANIFAKTGYKTTKEYYVNDAGNQINILAKSLEIRLRQLRGEQIDLPENHYMGEYIINIAKTINNKIKSDEDFKKLNFKELAITNILKLIEDDLQGLGIHYDSWFHESILCNTTNKESALDSVLNTLKEKKFLQKHDGAWWLMTTETDHDEKNRVVIREDGRPTYFATDIAYHYDKYKRGFDKLINIWGADHHGYVQRLKAAVSYLGYDENSLQIILYQLVSLLRDGKKIAMSTRQGQFVALREVLDEVGRDAVRFFVLMRSSDNPIEFDLELAKEQSNNNPVYYIQYAHARISSIYRESKGEYVEDIKNALSNLDILLKEEEALNVAKMLVQFSDIIQLCVRDSSPHYLTVYLLELAKTFHHYYTKHKILLNENKPLAGARLVLCHTVAIVIKNGLDLLGISAPEKM